MILDRADADTVVTVSARYGQMMVIKGDRYMGRAFQVYGEYSESEVDLWRQILPDNAIVADVGANIGAHTVALATLVPKGLVFAFEPCRFMYQLMAGNAALNGLTNVVPYHMAVGAEAGTITVPGFDYTADNNYGGIPLGGFDANQGNPVPVAPLDSLLPRVHMIKADVEGMELAVLQGAERLIDECRPAIYMEANPEDGHPPTEGPTQLELIGHVQAKGYDCWWHFAPHYNPDNMNKAEAEGEHEATVVSYNVLCLPAEGENNVNLPKIAPIEKNPPGGSEDPTEGGEA